MNHENIWIVCEDHGPIPGACPAIGFAEVEDSEKSLENLEKWCLKKNYKAFKYLSYRYAFSEIALKSLRVIAKFVD